MLNIIIRPDYTKTFCIDCDINSNIGTIKNKIKENLCINDNQYYLAFGGKIIKDNEKVMENIEK